MNETTTKPKPMGWLTRLFQLGSNPTRVEDGAESDDSARNSACNRLKLVLMHDRSQLEPSVMEKLRDELVEVISRYVVIDKDALDLSLESESNTIALVANIPVLRSRTTAS